MPNFGIELIQRKSQRPNPFLKKWGHNGGTEFEVNIFANLETLNGILCTWAAMVAGQKQGRFVQNTISSLQTKPPFRGINFDISCDRSACPGAVACFGSFFPEPFKHSQRNMFRR